MNMLTKLLHLDSDRFGGAANSAAEELAALRQALNTSMAVIEFNLDGTVIQANQNFLNVMGYKAEEIVGKHHRIFVAPGEAKTPEYEAFWEKLRAGEFHSDKFRRVNRAGADVWIQATYNPLINARGELEKIIKFASDVTEQTERSAHFESQVAAIHKSRASIELTMDGTIVDVNDLYLEITGYEREELLSNNHRALLLEEDQQGEAYSAFWQGLKQGQFQSDCYGRRHKNGSQLWMQTIYNPVRNALGEVYRVAAFATDVTASVNKEKVRHAVISEAQDVLAKVAVGDLKELVNEVDEPEVSAIPESINGTITKLREIVTRIKQGADHVATGATEISEGNLNLSRRTEQQASALEQTASSMEQMTSTVKQNADNAQEANQLALRAREHAEKGGTVVSDAVSAMSAINQSSKRIADIISVIDEIAFQTNLLALNAAVEAARAGEQGRGFAVVAAEVRNLAGRSATAAKEIKSLIEDSVGKVSQGSELVDQSGQTLEEIVVAVKKVTDIVGEIAAASKEQASGIEQVNKAVLEMDDSTQQNAALVEQAAAASSAVGDEAKRLREMVGFFSLDSSAVPVTETPAPTIVERRSAARPWSESASNNEPQMAAAPAAAQATGTDGGGDDVWDEF